MNELWRVQLGTGEVRMMTIDDLDRAFDAGYIHSRTNVLAPGSFKWTTLGEAAGLDEPAPYVEQTPSLAPMAIAGNGYAFPQIPQHQPYSMGASFGLDDDDAFGAKKSKKGLIAGFVIAGAAAVCAFFVTTSSPAVQSTVASAHVESKVASATLAPAAAEKLPEAAKPAETPKAEPTTVGKMTDDMKKKLLEADKEREAKAAKKGKGKRRKGAAPAAETEGNSQPAPPAHKMVEGGDKYDPLNGSI